jgi:hypothetical protein
MLSENGLDEIRQCPVFDLCVPLGCREQVGINPERNRMLHRAWLYRRVLLSDTKSNTRTRQF